MTNYVDHALDMELTGPEGVRVTVPTRLRYRADEPLAVQFRFDRAPSGPVLWVFARELLTEGLSAPAGEGDVRVWPTRADGRALLHVTLSAPGGSAHLTTALTPVRKWLCRTYRLVPAERESEALDLEHHLTRFLEDSS